MHLTEYPYWKDTFPDKEGRLKSKQPDSHTGPYITDSHAFGSPDPKHHRHHPYPEFNRELVNQGVCFTSNSSLAGFDWDQDDTPAFVRTFLDDNTHEKSLSGTREHAYLHIEKGDNTCKWQSSNWKCEFFLNNSFMVVTNPTIHELNSHVYTFDELNSLGFELTLEAKEVNPILESPLEPMDLERLESLFNDLPLDKNHCLHSRIEEAYKAVRHKEYTPYGFWLDGILSIHAAGLPFQFAVEWSRRDPDFKNEADVRKHWPDKPNLDRARVSVRSMQAIHRRVYIQWPGKIMKKNPQLQDPQNKRYIISYNKLNAHKCYGNLYIEVDSDSKWAFKTYLNEDLDEFDPNLPLDMFNLIGPLQKNQVEFACEDLAAQMGAVGNSVGKQVANRLLANTTQISIVKRWLDTPPAEHPVKLYERDTIKKRSSLDWLLDRLELPPNEDPKFVKILLKKAFCQIVRATRPSLMERPREGFLMLKGPKGRGKSRFFGNLTPPIRRLFSSITTIPTSTSDFRATLKRMEAMVCCIDEVDNMLEKQPVFLKALLTDNHTEFLEIYETSLKEVVQNALMCGGTNAPVLRLEAESRRFWVVLVDKIDNEAIEKEFSLYHFYRNCIPFLDEKLADKESPWTLSPEQIEENSKRNLPYITQTDGALLLGRIFDKSQYHLGLEEISRLFTSPYPTPNTTKHPNLFSLEQVNSYLRNEQGGSYNKIKPTELETYLLPELSQHFTGFKNAVKLLHRANCIVNQGKLTYGNCTKFYVLPPLIKPEVADVQAPSLV